jgi:hypothetical protein
MSNLLLKSLGYVLESASKSKTMDSAKEEVFSAFWAWVRPLFIYDVPDIETNGEDPTTKQKTEDRLKVLLQNQEFKKEFLQKITDLESKVVTEKNIVRSEIDGVKKIRVGDTDVNPNEQYDRKNIVEGPVRNADEFRLGDGD